MAACGFENDTSVIETISANSRDRCLDQCKNEDNCRWFTFDSLAGNCTLYQGSCGNVTQCEACVSGQKECDFSQVEITCPQGYHCSVGGLHASLYVINFIITCRA